MLESLHVMVHVYCVDIVCIQCRFNVSYGIPNKIPGVYMYLSVHVHAWECTRHTMLLSLPFDLFSTMHPLCLYSEHPVYIHSICMFMGCSVTPRNHTCEGLL